MTTPVDWEERTRIAADAAKALEIADNDNNGMGILPSAKYMKAGIHSTVADIIFYAGGSTIEETYVLAFGDMVILYYGDNESIEFLVINSDDQEDFLVVSENAKRTEVVRASEFHVWFKHLTQWLQESIGIIEKEDEINNDYEDLVENAVSLPDL